MQIRLLPRLLSCVIVFSAVAACGERGPNTSSDPQWTATLEGVTASVAAATGYPVNAIDVTASSAHVRVSISNSTLAETDQMGRENAASVVAAAVETALASHKELAGVQVISVAIIHPASTGQTASSAHTEDVLEFRKGPNQRFSHHIT